MQIRHLIKQTIPNLYNFSTKTKIYCKALSRTHSKEIPGADQNEDQISKKSSTNYLLLLHRNAKRRNFTMCEKGTKKKQNIYVGYL